MKKNGTPIYYAGIGARKTPKDICRKMSTAGKAMAGLGFILRSGGAAGADISFERGALEPYGWQAGSDEHDVSAVAEIYLPYKGFNGHRSPLYGTCREARLIAKEYHPRWDILSCRGRDFHGRNVYQILGKDLRTPVSFVLCWTPRGAVTGGTGQALRIADAYGIPVLNFATHTEDDISEFVLDLHERSRA